MNSRPFIGRGQGGCQATRAPKPLPRRAVGRDENGYSDSVPKHDRLWDPPRRPFSAPSPLAPRSNSPRVTIVPENAADTVAALKAQPGRDIMLFGGGLLFRTLAEAGLVDTVEVAVIPILLGQGIPLLPSPAKTIKLTLKNHRVYTTGIVSLEYAVNE